MTDNELAVMDWETEGGFSPPTTGEYSKVGRTSPHGVKCAYCGSACGPMIRNENRSYVGLRHLPRFGTVRDDIASGEVWPDGAS